MEEEQADDVAQQTEGTDNNNDLWVADFGRRDQSADSFEEDGNAKGDEEDTVDECT